MKNNSRNYPILLFLLTAIILTSCGGGSDGGNDNVPGTIQLAGTAFDVSEGQVANIIVTRSGGTAGAVSVDYAVTDGTAVAGSEDTDIVPKSHAPSIVMRPVKVVKQPTAGSPCRDGSWLENPPRSGESGRNE